MRWGGWNRKKKSQMKMKTEEQEVEEDEKKIKQNKTKNEIYYYVLLDRMKRRMRQLYIIYWSLMKWYILL